MKNILISKKSNWFKEWFTENEAHIHKIKKIIISKKTKFQDCLIADFYEFDRGLVLDGEMQSAIYDEFIYHESLVHPAMILHPNPEKILIMGGGEGATTRELLKYKSVKKIVMVDIDGEVVDLCKKYLYKWHRGAFDNPKVELIIDDAKNFIENTQERFDIIISDLPTPIEKGPAYQLYTQEFYKFLKKKLNHKGIFILQAGSGNLLQIKLHCVLYNTLKDIFKFVFPFYAYVPSFDVPWAFLITSDLYDPTKYSVQEIEKRIKQKINAPLRFYDGITHQGLFFIPKHIRTLLNNEKRKFTLIKPMYFYK